MKLIYIANAEVSVFDSQVVELLNYYCASSLFEDMVFVAGHRYNKKIFNITSKLNKNIRVVLYKHYPQYPIIGRLTTNSIYQALLKINNLENYIIHVRNDVLSHYVYKAVARLGKTRIRIIADVRGAGFEQIREYSKRNVFMLKLKEIQRKKVYKTLLKIKNVSAVSTALSSYVKDKAKTNRLNISVISCLAGQNFRYYNDYRKEIRDKLGVSENDILLVMSTGGGHDWQKTDDTIKKLVSKNFKILNLSKNKYSHPNIINTFVPYQDVAKYLSAADIAIIWRDKAITNKVASPVKFSEYIACGLPVITNDSIDLITHFIDQNHCGIVLNEMDEIDEQIVCNLKSINRSELSFLGHKQFGTQAIANKYIEFYKSAAEISK